MLAFHNKPFYYFFGPIFHYERNFFPFLLCFGRLAAIFLYVNYEATLGLHASRRQQVDFPFTPINNSKIMFNSGILLSLVTTVFLRQDYKQEKLK